MKALTKLTSVIVLGSATAAAVASPALQIINKTPYVAEVSGLVGANVSSNMKSENEKIQIKSQGDFVGHIMLVAPGKSGYVDNIIVRSIHGRLRTVELYGEVGIGLKLNRLTIMTRK